VNLGAYCVGIAAFGVTRRCVEHGLGTRVLPDGPATRGAATPLRTEAFGGALPLVANGISADQREGHAK
jgi:hypothetical protein